METPSKYLASIGSIGGSKKTEAQQKARRLNVQKANQERISKNARRLKQRKAKYQESLKNCWLGKEQK